MSRFKLSCKETYDLVVIGGGAGGYEAAVRAAQLGGRVALVEKWKIGGYCVNKGCIPTKALLRSVEVLRTSHLSRVRSLGLVTGEASLDWKTMKDRKNELVESLVEGMEARLRKLGVEIVKGSGSIFRKGTVEVKKEGGGVERLNVKNIIIATGVEYRSLPPPYFKREETLTIEDIMEMECPPESILIYGSNFIGIEFSALFKALGSDVTMIESASQILPEEDAEITNLLKDALEIQDINVITNAEVKKIDGVEGKRTVSVSSGNNKTEVQFEKIFAPPEPSPNVKVLGLDRVGVKEDEEKIIVNDRMETNVPGIYAVGDVVGKYYLSHVASLEGIIAAENAMGKSSKIDYRAVPRCVYSSPEVACVGLTEEQARKFGHKTKTGTFPFFMNAGAHIQGEIEGVVKMVIEEEFGEILGIHMLGPKASLLVSEGALAIKLEATIEELANTFHPHPTLSEALRDSARQIGCG